MRNTPTANTVLEYSAYLLLLFPHSNSISNQPVRSSISVKNVPSEYSPPQ